MRILKGKVGARGIALVVSGLLIGALFVTPAGAHVGDTVKHLWQQHIRPLADQRYNRDVIRPGQTVRGTIGAQYDVYHGGDELAANASLPMEAPFGIDDDHVEVLGSDGDSTECPGTSTAPTASPGYVCIYPFFTGNATTLVGYMWGTSAGGRWGFQISWLSEDNTSYSVVFANWAYTAPASAPLAADKGAGSTSRGGGAAEG